MLPLCIYFGTCLLLLAIIKMRLSIYKKTSDTYACRVQVKPFMSIHPKQAVYSTIFIIYPNGSIRLLFKAFTLWPRCGFIIQLGFTHVCTCKTIPLRRVSCFFNRSWCFFLALSYSFLALEVSPASSDLPWIHEKSRN